METVYSFPGMSAQSPFPLMVAGKWKKSRKFRQYVPFSSVLPVPGGKGSWEVSEAEESEIAEALAGLAAAKKAMAGLSRSRRSRILEETARLLEIHRESLAFLMVQEVGKPLSAARFEVERAAATFRTAGHLAAGYGTEWMPGDSVPQGVGMTGLVERVPKGTVLAITPYNFPLNLLAHKVAPAVAAGCPLIVKPAPFGALTALSMGSLLLEAGLPPEALSILPADVAGTLSLVDHPEIEVISFTGSDRVGWSLRERVPRKTVLLELGGNAAVLVAEDARISGLSERLVSGSFAYAGQICISIQRILIHRSCFNEVVEGMTSRIRHLEEEGAIGDPGMPEVLMGPLIHGQHAGRVWDTVQMSLQNGARALTPLRREECLIHPVILGDTDESDPVEQDEIFGPVVTVTPFDRIDEAIGRINRSRYGLQSGIFTGSLEKGLSWAARIESGGVFINEIPTFRLDHWPYGGIKESGSGSEGVSFAMEEMTRPKLVAFRRHQEAE
ncbi:MAG: aldehyde dehydrogenase family protein [Leptospirales bacterium]